MSSTQLEFRGKIFEVEFDYTPEEKVDIKKNGYKK